MVAHSTLSPSSSDRWINCPASIRLSADAPPQPQSEAAAEGSVAHLLPEALVGGTADELSLMERVGTIVPYGKFKFTITDEMLDGALLFNNVVEEDKKKLTKPASINCLVEKRVIASSIDKQVWGKADTILFQKGNSLFVYDYKYGRRYIVEAKDNSQALIYLIGAMNTFAGTAFDHLEIIIVQPRGEHKNGPVRRWVVSKKEIVEFVDKARMAVGRTKDPNQKPKTGKWCVFCPAKQVNAKTGLPFCPAIREGLQKALETDFEIITTESVKALPSIDKMPLDKLALILDWEDEIKDWVKAAHERAKSILDSGGEIPRYKLVEGRKGNRSYVEGAEKKVEAEFGDVLGEDAIYEPRKLKSAATIEKLVGKKEFAALEVTERAKPGQSIVPVSDKRPAVKASPERDFTDLTKDQGPVWPS